MDVSYLDDEEKKVLQKIFYKFNDDQNLGVDAMLQKLNNQSDKARNQLDIDDYLSDKEKSMLETLNKKSNNTRNEIIEDEKFLNKSLSKLANIWALKMREVINDLTTFFHNVGTNYQQYFSDINNVNNWWTGIVTLIIELYHIFTKNKRSIYVGATLIFLSLMIYLILITS